MDELIERLCASLFWHEAQLLALEERATEADNAALASLRLQIYRSNRWIEVAHGKAMLEVTRRPSFRGVDGGEATAWAPSVELILQQRALAKEKKRKGIGR